MKIAIVGSVYKDINIFNKIILETDCDAVLCTGNVGIKNHILAPYISGEKVFKKFIYVVPGIIEDFNLVDSIVNREIVIPNFFIFKQGQKIDISHNGETVGVTGFGKGFSPVSYTKDILEGKRIRHFNKTEMEELKRNLATNIILMHELPNQWLGNSMNFSDDTFVLLQNTLALYLFCGKYEKWLLYRHKNGINHSTYLTFLPKANSDYGILDTKKWSFSSISIVKNEGA